MNLLIVNDEELTASSIQKDISWSEYGILKTFLAFNSIKAKEIISENKIDIVLLDIEMPEENGITLLKWIRNQGLKTECVFLTCHASFEYAQEAIKLGCGEYILMPTRYEEIGEVVKKTVNKILDNAENMKLQEYGKTWVRAFSEEANLLKLHKSSPTKTVEDAEKYIMDNICKVDLSVNEVASYCCLTPIYMSRIFKKNKGINISQFIIQEKMILSKRLLLETDYNAYNVAIQVGYLSYPHFSSTFKKFFGISPSQLSKKV